MRRKLGLCGDAIGFLLCPQPQAVLLGLAAGFMCTDQYAIRKYTTGAVLLVFDI
jgi:hypothetical protein